MHFYTETVRVSNLLESPCPLSENSNETETRKHSLDITYESRDTLKSFNLFLAVKTITKLNMEHSVKFEIEIQKLSHRRSRSPDNTKFDHFTLLFCRGRTEIYEDL